MAAAPITMPTANKVQTTLKSDGPGSVAGRGMGNLIPNMNGNKKPANGRSVIATI